MLSQKDPQPRSSEESKYGDTFLAKGMTGEQNLGGLKETVDVGEGNKTTGVMGNKREYLVGDDNSGLTIVAPQNRNSLELVAFGDSIPGRFAEGQHHPRRQPDLSGFLAHSESASMSSGQRINPDWMDSNSSLISDLCDIFQDGIMEGGMKDMEYFLKPALTRMMQALIDRIIKEPHIIPISEWSADTRQCPHRSSVVV